MAREWYLLVGGLDDGELNGPFTAKREAIWMSGNDLSPTVRCCPGIYTKGRDYIFTKDAALANGFEWAFIKGGAK